MFVVVVLDDGSCLGKFGNGADRYSEFVGILDSWY